MSAIVTEEVDGQRLGDDEVFGFLRLLFPAGVDTTWLTLGILMGAVLQQPVSVRDRLLASSEEREWAIEETLRWESTTGSEPRVTLEDVVLSGTEIPAGKLLRLAVPVANRDPLVFEDPDQWSLDRRPTNHLAFGLGRHFCLGAFLARAELNVALEVLLRATCRTCDWTKSSGSTEWCCAARARCPSRGTFPDATVGAPEGAPTDLHVVLRATAGSGTIPSRR